MDTRVCLLAGALGRSVISEIPGQGNTFRAESGFRFVSGIGEAEAGANEVLAD